MKSLYGSITRSAVISLSYVTVMRIPSLLPNHRSAAAGAALTHRHAAHNRKGAAPAAATDCSASLASIRLPTPFVFHLHTFHDADIALRAGAECRKRLLVSLAFVSRPGDVIAVEFDKDRRLLQSGFVDLLLASGHGQKAPAE